MDEHQENPDGPTTPQDPAGDDTAAPDFDIVTVTWQGTSWNVPKDRGRWDMNVAFELEEGNNMRALVLLLGGRDNFTKTRAQVYEMCSTKADFDVFEKHVGEVLNKECIN